MNGLNRIFLYLIAVNASFLFGAAFLDNDFLVELCNALAAGSWIAVAASYSPEAARAIRRGTYNGWEIAIIGIFSAGVFIAMTRIWGQSWRILGQPDWMIHSPVLAFISFGLAVSGWMIVISPGTKVGEVPVQNWWWVLAAIMVGIFMAGLMLGLVLRSPYISLWLQP